MGKTVLTVDDGTGDVFQHDGWTDVAVTRSLEQFASTFNISFNQRWTEEQLAIPIREGYACTLSLDGTKVISGYVDDAAVDQDATSLSLSVAGRSKAGDLVDCSAIHQTGAWKNATLFQIVSDLIQPFGLSAVTDPSVISTNINELFDSFAIQLGETVYETMERGCRSRGVLLASDADGTVRLTNVSAKTTATKILRGVGGNVISGGRSGSMRERFSQVSVYAQSVGKAGYAQKQVSQQKYTIKDDAVTRYRPLIIKAEKGFGTAQKLQTRAVWERNVRAGKAQRLHYTLDGWSNAEGLWQPNVLVTVDDSVLEVKTTMLVVSVTQRKSIEAGTNVDLELCDPRALTVEPLTTQKAHKRGASYYVTGSAPAGVEDNSGSAGDD